MAISSIFKTKCAVIACLGLITATASCNGGGTHKQEPLSILVGSYTAPGDTSLRLMVFDPESMTLRVADGTAGVRNASYIVQSPSTGIIYVASEGDSVTAAVTALRPLGEGKMPEQINSLFSGSAAPCYINISPDGRFITTADYNGSTASVFGIRGDGGLDSLRQRIRFEGHGAIEGQQDIPHPHCTAFTPDGKWLLVDDLGTDRIHQIPLLTDSCILAAAELQRDVVLPPASGPRHIVFNKQGTFAYLINEISDSVTVFKVTSEGIAPLRQYAADEDGGHGAGDIRLSRDGRHLYASLRLKNDGIAIFDVDSVTGKLEKKGHFATGIHPRNFIVTPDDRFVIAATKNPGFIEVYKRNPESGMLMETGLKHPVSNAVCVLPVNL